MMFDAAQFKKYQPRIQHWWRGAVAASIQGGAISVKAFFATAGASATGIPVAPMDLKQAGAVLVGGCIFHLADYLSKNPLPDEATATPAEAAK